MEIPNRFKGVTVTRQFQENETVFKVEGETSIHAKFGAGEMTGYAYGIGAAKALNGSANQFEEALRKAGSTVKRVDY